jgi:tRNA(adenine34) deaminase
VGAVVLRAETGQILGEGKNEILLRKDPTAHAEVLAIRSACLAENSERLSRAVLVSTLEPCTLCTGAALFARVERVLYMAPVFTGAGIGKLLEAHGNLYNHRPALEQADELYAERARSLLLEFFRARRT